MVVGAILQASAFSLAHLIVGRIITGMGNGLNTSTVPTWQSECSKSHRRGQMVMIEGALITGGICISYWIDFAFSFVKSEAAWRFPIAFQIVFALMILAVIMELPESPRWLILKGQEEEALEVLAILSAKPTDDKYIQSEFAAIKDTVLEQEQSTFRDLFTMDENRHFHRVMLGYVNQMCQQISGMALNPFSRNDLTQFQVSISSPTMRQRSIRTKSGSRDSSPEFSRLAMEPNTSWPRGSRYLSLRKSVDANLCSSVPLASPLQ